VATDLKGKISEEAHNIMGKIRAHFADMDSVWVFREIAEALQ